MIEVEHICLSFGERKILEDVNLTVYDGETMVILGASGSGKSTLLKLIIGLLKPDSGSIRVNGKEISSLTEREMNEERRRMGMVFQYSALFDSMNVKENVAFGLRQHTDLSEEEIENITEGKLHLVGLDDVGDLMPADLSGGMKKRVSLARAIVLNPQIILYDEPTAGLDPIRATDISLLIKQMQKEMKVTSIVVTHDLKSAEMVADRMAFLYKGSFLAVGTAEALASSRDYRVKQFMNGLPSEQYTVRRVNLVEMVTRSESRSIFLYRNFTFFRDYNSAKQCCFVWQKRISCNSIFSGSRRDRAGKPYSLCRC